MDPVLVALVLLVLALWYAGSGRRAFAAKVNALPGPGGIYPVSILRDMVRHNFEVLSLGYEYSRRFQDLYCVWVWWFPYVTLNSADNVEAVLSSAKHIEKSSDYSILHPWLRGGLLTSSGAKWHARRRLLTPTFHFRILEDFVPVFNKTASALVRALRKEAVGPDAGPDAGRHFDIGHYVHLATLDAICESAMGTSVHALEYAESDYVTSVKIACKNAHLRLTKPWFYPDLTFYCSPYGRAFQRALKTLHALTRSVIRTRRKEREAEESNPLQRSHQEEDGVRRRLAFLDQLLLANEKGAGLSDLDIQEEVDTFMFEGHDTTGSAISFALFLLSKHQNVQERVLEEVLRTLGPDQSRDLTVGDLRDLKYLEQVIKEALRIYPSVPLLMRVLRTDLHLKSGHVVPAGSTVVVSPFLLHRVEALWPDPERFDPDRFLPENCAARHPYAYIPFSAGARNCIGQKFAMMKMKAMIAKLVLEYRFLEAFPGYYPAVIDQITLQAKEGGPLLRLQRRRQWRSHDEH